jgi:hypothetical protein
LNRDTQLAQPPDVMSDQKLLLPLVQRRCYPVFESFLRFQELPGGSDIYSQGRRRGYALRASADYLIAAIPLENRVPVWHRDRDLRVNSKVPGFDRRRATLIDPECA